MSFSDGTALESLLHSVIGWGSCRMGFRRKQQVLFSQINIMYLEVLSHILMVTTHDYHKDDLANSQESNYNNI